MCERETLFMKSALKALHSDHFLKMKVGVMLDWKLMDMSVASLFFVFCFFLLVFPPPRNHLTCGYKTSIMAHTPSKEENYNHTIKYINFWQMNAAIELKHVIAG